MRRCSYSLRKTMVARDAVDGQKEGIPALSPNFYLSSDSRFSIAPEQLRLVALLLLSP